MESLEDDRGLYEWLRSLHNGVEDHRSGWEKRLEDKLEKSLAEEESKNTKRKRK